MRAKLLGAGILQRRKGKRRLCAYWSATTVVGRYYGPTDLYEEKKKKE